MATHPGSGPASPRYNRVDGAASGHGRQTPVVISPETVSPWVDDFRDTKG